MREELKQINTVYNEIQDVIDPMGDLQIEKSIQNLSPNKYTEYAEVYEINCRKLFEIIHTCNAQEIKVAYLEGCRLLQRNLSGYMAKNYDSLYLPVFEQAVKDGHTHTGWIFLRVLIEKDLDSYKYLLIKCLTIEGFEEVSLSLIAKYNICDALPQLIAMANSELYTDYKRLVGTVMSRLDC